MLQHTGLEVLVVYVGKITACERCASHDLRPSLRGYQRLYIEPAWIIIVAAWCALSLVLEPLAPWLPATSPPLSLFQT